MNILRTMTLSVCLVSSSSAVYAGAERSLALINAVIQHEHDIAFIREDIDALWHICYEYADIQDGLIKHRLDDTTSYTQNIYKKKICRRESCLDSDIIAHRQRTQDLYVAIKTAVNDIRTLVADGVVVTAHDHFGKTALNYCYTREIYAELIRQGVPFQWKVWAYFNPETAGWCAVAGLTGAFLIAASVSR